jgi:hypothetical protein
MAQEDWRLTNQERYLQGVALYRRRYVKPRPEWDHDHCSFCWAKFMEEDRPGVLHEGYVTENNYHWICEKCFNDFAERFKWIVK